MTKKLNKLTVNKTTFFIESLLLFFIVLSMIISDWVIGPLAVSELLMISILVLTVIVDPSLLMKLKTYWIAYLTLYMVSHIAINHFINEAFVLRLGIYSLIKVLFFFVFVNIMYAYIKKNTLEIKFLRTLNIGAMVAILIGLYITISIAAELEWPYEFLWSFTRTSSFTYEFKGNSDIIRTRSLFSEPAHLGYFLNGVLGINLFSDFKDKYGLYFQFVIIAGILSTLSYASIGVFTALMIIKAVQLLKNNDLNKVFQSKGVLVTLFVLTILTIFIFRDFLYTTIIERTVGIFDGTDNSAYNRMINSWTYVDGDYLIFGNGIAHSPPLQNTYAYFLTDLGVIGFTGIIFATYKLLKLNSSIGLMFILLNFTKGGYLSPMFPLLILMFIVFANNKSENSPAHLLNL